MASPRLRLAVDAVTWDPTPPEIEFLLTLLCERERTACMAFRRAEDKKRAVISRLLQRHAASSCLGLDFHEVATARTKGNKPFVSNARLPVTPMNWNYSVSHEGQYVVLCSESPAVTGCDITAPRSYRTGRQQTIEEYLHSFRSQLTQAEWDGIMALRPDEAGMEAQFQRIWSLKEGNALRYKEPAHDITAGPLSNAVQATQAYAKALGLGLAAPLASAEFTLSSDMDSATLSLAGEPQPRWAFRLHQLPQGHWVAVARGPPSDIVDAHGAFTATLSVRSFDAEEWVAALQAPEPPFAMLPICSLLPAGDLPAYEAAGGDVF